MSEIKSLRLNRVLRLSILSNPSSIALPAISITTLTNQLK
jgi:hypothetical protein